MTSGFGVDPTYDSNGKVISSTTSQDIRKIFGALYSPGLISGGAITLSSSAMTYTVAPGVAIIKTATGQNIATPFDQATVATSAGPSTGTRTDLIYVQQRFPSDGDSNAVIGVGTVAPVNSAIIGRYVVGTGATNTSAAVKTGSIDFSIPYGGSLGILHQWTDTFTGVHNQNNLRLGSKSITLPTDRLLRFTVTSLLYASGAVGFDNSKYCEWITQPEVDNIALTTWNSPGLHQAWATWSWEAYATVSAGTHTVSYSRWRGVGPGSAGTYYGTYNGNPYGGTVFTVRDAGVVQ